MDELIQFQNILSFLQSRYCVNQTDIAIRVFMLNVFYSLKCSETPPNEALVKPM